MKITPEKQAEVDAIRNEILNAVNSQIYKNNAPVSANAVKATADAAAKSNAKTTAKDPIVSSAAVSPVWDRIQQSRKNIYGLVNPKQSKESAEPEPPKNTKFLGKFNLQSNSYRDVIDLVEVQERLEFDLDEVVHVWRTIPHSMPGNEHLLLGLTNDTLIMGKLVGGLFRRIDQLKFSDKQLNRNGLEAFQHWNNKIGQTEGYAIIAAKDELMWIRLGVDREFKKLEIMWEWSIHKTVVTFRYFRHNNDSMVFLLNEGSPCLDIYKFSLDNKDFSHSQIIRFKERAQNIAIVEWKKQLLLALPLRNTTQIYRYSDKFILMKTVPTKGVTTVAGFQAGGLCFFAIAGEEPQILRYRHNGLNPVKILSKTFTFVRSWYPIPVHTFRDDVLLLAEFEVPFDTHTLSRISTLRWNGEAFESFFNVPCYMDDVPHYNGVSCLIDSDESMGLAGSVILCKSNNVSMVVPRKQVKSGLFDLKIEIRAAPHPKEEKLIEIQMMFDYFSSLKQYNDLVFKNALDTIKNAVLPNKDLVVTGDWTVDVLDAQSVVLEKEKAESSEKEKRDESKGSEKEKQVTSENLVPVLNETVHELIDLELLVNRAVSKEVGQQTARNNDPPFSPRLQIDAVKVDEIYADKINGIPSEDIVWLLEDDIKFTGSLEVHSVSVSNIFEGNLNGINISRDLVSGKNNKIQGKSNFLFLDVDRLSTSSDINGGLLEAASQSRKHFDKLVTQDLFVENEIVADEINGNDWKSLTQQMVFRSFDPGNVSLVVEGVS